VPLREHPTGLPKEDVLVARGCLFCTEAPEYPNSGEDVLILEEGDSHLRSMTKGETALPLLTEADDNVDRVLVVGKAGIQ